MRNHITGAVLCSMICAGLGQSALADTDYVPDIVFAAPKLVMEVTPTSGQVPVDVGFRVTEVFHPWGVEYVHVRVMRKLGEDSYFPYGSHRELTEGGHNNIGPWYDEIYITEAYEYVAFATIVHGDAPDGYDSWEFEPGGNDRLEIPLNFSERTIDLPEPRPIQNAGYKQPYEFKQRIPNPDYPFCIYSIFPLEGPVPLTLEINMAGCYSPAGNAIKDYELGFEGLAYMVPGMPESDESTVRFPGDFENQLFLDPQYKVAVEHAGYTIGLLTNSFSRWEIREPGGYGLSLATTDINALGSKCWVEYINVLGPGDQPPVAVLTSLPVKVELDEITMLQYAVDQGIDPASVAGREAETIRVAPRGALAVTLDASGSYDPDGNIACYAWYIYGEHEFNYRTTNRPQLTFFVDSAAWPTTGLSVGVLVADNDGYSAQEHLIIEVEQQMPFGVMVDVVEGDDPLSREHDHLPGR